MGRQETGLGICRRVGDTRTGGEGVGVARGRADGGSRGGRRVDGVSLWGGGVVRR